MHDEKTAWHCALDWIQEMMTKHVDKLPTILPPQNDPAFWQEVCRVEIAIRDTLSEKIRLLLKLEGPVALTDAEHYVLGLRLQWAEQLASEYIAQRHDFYEPTKDVLEWLLIDSWNEHGCISLWNHSDRAGS